MRTLKDQAAIVGVGATEFSKNSGRSELQLAAECVRNALDDCGLKPSDVDGMTTFTLDTSDDIEVARAVGIGDLTLFSRVPHGGGAATGLLHQAAMAIATGVAKVVVCYRALNGRSGQRYSEGVGGTVTTSDLIHWGWYIPYGLLTPASWVAMFTQRYMHDYGATSEDLAQVAVSTRKHAVTNPNAFFYGKPLTVEDHQSSRWIVEPLHLFDCCQETDGGCAVVVTTPERARDLKQPPAIIRAGAMAAGSHHIRLSTLFARDWEAESPVRAARQLFAMAECAPADIDVAFFYDFFTSLVINALEQYGFAPPGQGGPFVENGGIEWGKGRLPCNTNGGQLSEAFIHGFNNTIEAVRQIRGTSTSQVEGCQLAFVAGGNTDPTGAILLRA